MIGKKVPTKDGSFKIEVPIDELEELQQGKGAASGFFAEWMRETIPNQLRKSSIEEMPLAIFELDDDYSVKRVYETTAKSASMTLDGRTYDIPLDMAITALQNMDENLEITYKEKEDE